jgi:hypothetical protein
MRICAYLIFLCHQDHCQVTNACSTWIFLHHTRSTWKWSLFGPFRAYSIAPAAFGRSIEIVTGGSGRGRQGDGRAAKNSHSFNFDLAFSGLVSEF